jgi:type II secretory pathway component GspD/PulD (secretin)
MKLNATLLSLIGLTATGIVVLAQDTPPAADTNQTPSITATNASANVATNVAADASTNVAANTSATAAVTPAPADAGTNAAPAAPAEAGTNPTVVHAEATPAVTPAAATPADAAPASGPVASTSASTNNAAAQRDPNATIPLIVMDEVPLTDAIKNLARQAGLNYMLDPKINFGAPGPNGVNPQPMVSLRWENLTADQALAAVLANNNLVIIEDPKTRIARITVKDPAAPDPLITKIIQLKFAYVTNVVGNVQNVLQDKRSKVSSDVRTSQLVVLATEKELVGIDELVTRLDTPNKQVLIEARLVETSKNPTSVKGIDWSGTLSRQNMTFGNGNTAALTTSSSGNTTAINAGTGSLPVGTINPPFVGPNPTILTTTTPGGGSTVSAAGTGFTSGSTYGQLIQSLAGNGGIGLNTAKGFFPATAFLNADGVSAALSFLNTDLDSTVISTPRAVTLDNEMATLAVTRAQPIFATTAGTQGSPGGSQVTYTNLGTILKVTPRISANNHVLLKVVPEVSSVAGVATKTVAGLVSQADIFDVRHIETQVLIPSGNTLVMGGLISDDRSKGYIKVPLLGDIPFLGAAFRHESKSQIKKNLIIFITPTIVQSEDFQPTQTEFLKSKIPNEARTDFGAWDSGKPQDWSKLMHKAKKTDADADVFSPVK